MLCTQHQQTVIVTNDKSMIQCGCRSPQCVFILFQMNTAHFSHHKPGSKYCFQCLLGLYGFEICTEMILQRQQYQ